MARVRWLALIPPLAFAALAALFAAGMLRGGGSQELPSALIGRPAPMVAVPALGGHPAITPALLADGEPKLVNFFASWCAPCRIEHPVISALAAEGVPVLGIAYKDDPARTEAFLAELGNPYAALGADEAGRVAVDWGLYGVPETFVLAGDGTVIDRLPMPITPGGVEERLRASLAEAASR